MSEISLKNKLFDVNDSVLIVIDFQDSFLEKYSKSERNLLKNRVGWVVDVAVRLDIPLVAMAEEVPVMGGVSPEIQEKFPAGTPIFDKMIFGLAADEKIMAEIKKTGRKTAILVGLETDVCVAHSALGLMQAGYQVAVVADAVGAPGKAQEHGLARMKEAGVVITNVKSLFYEWMRTVQRCIDFYEKYEKEIGEPKNIIM
ncbi:MAG: isochorismatase family protein [Desulfobacterales bacterium]|nr:isochorismatase family protein [Desulfobacterales bacterium]